MRETQPLADHFWARDFAAATFAIVRTRECPRGRLKPAPPHHARRAGIALPDPDIGFAHPHVTHDPLVRVDRIRLLFSVRRTIIEPETTAESKKTYVKISRGISYLRRLNRRHFDPSFAVGGERTAKTGHRPNWGPGRTWIKTRLRQNSKSKNWQEYVLIYSHSASKISPSQVFFRTNDEEGSDDPVNFVRPISTSYARVDSEGRRFPADVRSRLYRSQ